MVTSAKTSADKLILGLPSKGRLMEDCFEFFASAGMTVKRSGGGRDYVGRVKEIKEIDVQFLSASEIALSLEAGDIHLGVTGRDLVFERAVRPQETILLVEALGFGHADVVVAVPETWIDVRSMEDLNDVTLAHRSKRDRALRVATKYINLTRDYFARQGITDYRIVESAGATEGAPAAGSAEIIVDITSTGATLAANALKILDDGVMMRSEAHLAASLTASWSEANRETVAGVFDRIAARAEARSTREMRCVVPGLDRVAAERLAKEHEARLILPPEDSRGSLLIVHCAEKDVHGLSAKLRSKGAKAVTVVWPDFVFTDTNDRFDLLQGRLVDL